MSMVIWFLVFWCNGAVILGQNNEPTVTISDGTLLGTTNQTIGLNKTYYAFRGIPYAQPPIGNLRFAAPVANSPWTGTYNATVDGSACTQSSGKVGSEDCLFINVYTTDLNGSLPVMVFIHGGGFTTDSSAYVNYPPDYLINKVMIFVSFNYRLGVFGFLSTGDSSAYGNWGLKDQILALQWVRTNIASFGGDPNKVTIAGQSAGAASISYLLDSGLTTGLYRGAIMESGTSLCPWTIARNAKTNAFSVGTILGITALTTKSLITQLRAANYVNLSAAENTVTAANLLTYGILEGKAFAVVKEPVHSGAVLTGDSHDMLERREFDDVPVIIGFNSNELGALQPSIDYLRPVLAQYDLLSSKLAPYAINTNAILKLEAGLQIRNRYFKLGVVASSAINITNFASMDQFFIPIRETARLMSAGAPVYYYEFGYTGSTLGDITATYSGVAHSFEQDFIFANRGTANEADSVIRDKLVTLWTNFVKYGNPTHSDNGTILGDLTWEPNKSSDNTAETIKYLNMNATFAMETNPDQEDWVFYEKVFEKYGDSSYDTY